MTCWCGADYDEAGQCPRCNGFVLGARDAGRETPLGLFDLPSFELPNLPWPDVLAGGADGPDELLSELAEMEAVVARERAALDESQGARRCRFCRKEVPAGTDSGVHEACWPVTLPEGSRSCTGCGECILDDDDGFEHDFCPYPSPDGDDEAEDTRPYEEDEIPTEPMPSEAPLRHEDSVRCTCGRWLPYALVAPVGAIDRNVTSAVTITCLCHVRIGVAYSWARSCVTGVSYQRPERALN